VNAAAHAAIDANFTKYTTNSGTEELKKAIAARYKADYGVEYKTSDIIVSAGGKQALYNAALVLFGEGDEVVTHSPGWPTLVEQIKLADAKPVVVQTHADEGFALRAEPLLAGFTPLTRGVIINSPGNPTGALMSELELEILAQECARREIWILLDLCYEKLIYDPTPHNLAAVLARINPDHSVICGSASKAYAMTGWRCGWAIGPTAVIAACNALQSHATSNVCSITQKAVTAALTGPQECVTEMLDEYRRRREQLCKWLSDEPRVKFVMPAGAFYLFIDVSDFLSPDGIRTSAQLAQSLLDDVRVAVTPGEAFDAPGFLRLSYATSLAELERGTKKILDYLHAAEARPAVAR
jgi:aspartate aminotransferase